MNKKLLPKQGEIFSIKQYHHDVTDMLWRIRQRFSRGMRWTLMGITTCMLVLPFFVNKPAVLQYTSSYSNPTPTQIMPSITPTPPTSSSTSNTGPSINAGYGAGGSSSWCPNADCLSVILPSITAGLQTANTILAAQNNTPTYQTIPTTPAQQPINTTSITQIDQQIQTQMTSCVARKQQVYTQLLNYNTQIKQLQAQRDTLSNSIPDATTTTQATALESQRDQLDNRLDAMDTTLSNTQEQLDNFISQCKDTISNLQSRRDDLESQLNDTFDQQLDYQLP